VVALPRGRGSVMGELAWLTRFSSEGRDSQETGADQQECPGFRHRTPDVGCAPLEVIEDGICGSSLSLHVYRGERCVGCDPEKGWWRGAGSRDSRRSRESGDGVGLAKGAAPEVDAEGSHGGWYRNGDDVCSSDESRFTSAEVGPRERA
jgi:hypothetical protein